jgi:hypothetical protein
MGECLSAKAKDNKGLARDFPRPAAGHSNPIAATPRPGVPARAWRAEAPGAKAVPFNNVLPLAPPPSLCQTLFQRHCVVYPPRKG